MPPGKIKLVGKQERVKLSEGKKSKTYFRLAQDGQMVLKAGGPTSLVILARTRADRNTRFELELDGEKSGQVQLELNSKVTRGFFIPIPAGGHRLVLRSSQPVVVRPVKVKRKAKPGEVKVAWVAKSAPRSDTLPASEPKVDSPEDKPAPESTLAATADPEQGKTQRPDPKSKVAEQAPPSAPPKAQSVLEQIQSGRSVMVLKVRGVGVDEQVTKPLGAALASQLARQPTLKVTTMEDARALLTHEQSRQLMECRDGTKCLASVASSLNTDWALASSLGRVGKSYTLTLSLIDVKQAATIARASETMAQVDGLLQAIPALVGRLLGVEQEGQELKFHMADGQKLSLAVMNLKPEGLPQELAGNLTQILSVELKRIEGTSVISRDDVSAMLQMEENKMMLGCDDASCMAEIGGALGVDKLVVGSVGKLSQSYVTTLRLIDVRNARVDGRVTETFRGEEDQLIRAVRHAGRRLFGIEPKLGGKLVVSASQEGAELHLDGELRGSLPGPPTQVKKSGRYLAKVSKSGYFDWQSEIYIDPGETTAIWSKLEARPERWYEKWWVWTVVGVVVVGGATTAGVLLQPEQKAGKGEVVLP